MGFSFKRALTPPKKVRDVVKKTVRYTGATFVSPFLTAAKSKQVFGLSANESKKFEVAAKVQRAVAGAAVVVVTGGAAIAALKGKALATTAAKVGAGKGVGGFLSGIFKKKGEQLQPQAEAIDNATTSTENPAPLDASNPGPFIYGSATPNLGGVFVEPEASLSAPIAADGPQIVRVSFFEKATRFFLSFVGA